jgi:hypothetical protein
MLLKRGPLTANIDVHVRCTLEPEERAIRVIRAFDLAIQIPGLLKLAEPLGRVCMRLLQPIQPKSLTLVGKTPRRKIGRRQR